MVFKIFLKIHFFTFLSKIICSGLGHFFAQGEGRAKKKGKKKNGTNCRKKEKKGVCWGETASMHDCPNSSSPLNSKFLLLSWSLKLARPPSYRLGPGLAWLWNCIGTLACFKSNNLLLLYQFLFLDYYLYSLSCKFCLTTIANRKKCPYPKSTFLG